MAAALAAGETPSPEMVAAAPKGGHVAPRGCSRSARFGHSVTGNSDVALKIRRYTSSYPSAEAPEVLQQEARNIAKSFGYTGALADSAYGFELDREYYRYLVAHRSELNPWGLLKYFAAWHGSILVSTSSRLADSL